MRHFQPPPVMRLLLSGETVDHGDCAVEGYRNQYQDQFHDGLLNPTNCEQSMRGQVKTPLRIVGQGKGGRADRSGPVRCVPDRPENARRTGEEC